MPPAPSDFDLLSEITHIEIIARGSGVDDRRRLNRDYGRARWRKLKGWAVIQLHLTGKIVFAELHWYEAAGLGRRELKRKKILKSYP
jgi:hypothetical protein